MLENSDAKVVVVEDEEQLEKIRAVRERLPMLEHVVRMTGSSEDAISIEDLAARGSGREASEWEARWSAVTPRGHLHLHLHLGHDRAAQGLRDQPRQLPLDARHGQRDQRGRARGRLLPLPAPRPLLRAADPARQLRPRRDARLLGARPAEDPAQPRRAEADLLPLGAPHLREDLHGGDQRDGKGGRPEEGGIRLVDRGRQEDARGASAAAAQPGLPPAQAVRVRRQACALENPRPVRRATCDWPSPAPPRSTPRSCASSTPPGSSCSRAGG